MQDVYFDFPPARQPGERKKVLDSCSRTAGPVPYSPGKCSVRKVYFPNDDSITYRIS